MQYFTIGEAQSLARSNVSYAQTAATLLKSAASSHYQGKTYDIFLSHAFADAELVLGAKKILEGYGHTVYVDWIEDAHLDRSKVTKEVAEYIRQRMKSCKRLVFATSENSSGSKWMPWELGFFDGHKPGNVAILPLMRNEKDNFKGQEYLSLYPVMGKGEAVGFYGYAKPELRIFDGQKEEVFRTAA